MKELIERILQYEDVYGCLVCKPAVEVTVNHPDQEDSLHKQGHTAALLSWLGGERLFSFDPYFSCFLPVPPPLGQRAVKRHPMSKYTTSRDQVMPFLIGFALTERRFTVIKQIDEWLKRCPVEKDKWKRYAWFIRMFRHTPNGDILQPDHVSTLLRCYDYCNFWKRCKIMFGDWWRLMGTLLYLVQGFSRHHVNHTLEVEFAARVRPTAMSEVTYRIWRKYGQPKRVYLEYFSGENNPPIGELYGKFLEASTQR